MFRVTIIFIAFLSLISCGGGGSSSNNNNGASGQEKNDAINYVVNHPTYQIGSYEDAKIESEGLDGLWLAISNTIDTTVDHELEDTSETGYSGTRKLYRITQEGDTLNLFDCFFASGTGVGTGNQVYADILHPLTISGNKLLFADHYNWMIRDADITISSDNEITGTYQIYRIVFGVETIINDITLNMIKIDTDDEVELGTFSAELAEEAGLESVDGSIRCIEDRVYTTIIKEDEGEAVKSGQAISLSSNEDFYLSLFQSSDRQSFKLYGLDGGNISIEDFELDIDLNIDNGSIFVESLEQPFTVDIDYQITF